VVTFLFGLAVAGIVIAVGGLLVSVIVAIFARHLG
jgi:hypothetical protein